MNLFSLSALEETYEEQYGEKSILTLGSKGKTVLRDPCSTFTLLELLFARIYGQKIAQLCV